MSSNGGISFVSETKSSSSGMSLISFKQYSRSGMSESDSRFRNTGHCSYRGDWSWRELMFRGFAKLKKFQKSKNNLEVGGWVQVPFG